MAFQADIEGTLRQLKEIEDTSEKPIDGQILAHALLMVFYCGISRKEIPELTCGNIIFSGDLPSAVVIGQDSIPLHADIQQAISAYLQYLRSKGHGAGPDAPLFPGYEGKSGEKKFSRHSDKVGVSVARLHREGIYRQYREFREAGLDEQQSAKNTALIYRMTSRSVLNSVNDTIPPPGSKPFEKLPPNEKIMNLHEDAEYLDVYEVLIENKLPALVGHYVEAVQGNKDKDELINYFLSYLEQRVKSIENALVRRRAPQQVDVQGPSYIESIRDRLRAETKKLSPQTGEEQPPTLSTQTSSAEGTPEAQESQGQQSTGIDDLMGLVTRLQASLSQDERNEIVKAWQNKQALKQAITSDVADIPDRASKTYPIHFSYQKGTQTTPARSTRVIEQRIINESIFSNIVRLIYFTGLFPVEIIKLKIRDVLRPEALKNCLLDNSYSITPELVLDEIQPVADTIPQGYQNISVVLTEPARAVMADHLQYIMSKGLMNAGHSLVFPRLIYRPYFESTINTAIKNKSTYSSYDELRRMGILMFCKAIANDNLPEMAKYMRIQRHARYSDIEQAKEVFTFSQDFREEDLQLRPLKVIFPNEDVPDDEEEQG